MLLGNQPVGPGDLGHQADQSFSDIFIYLNHIFQESHASEQNSMAFFLEAGRYLIQELSNILRNSLDNFDRSKDGLLPDIG